MTKPDPFDEIVRNLDLDLSFPEAAPAPEPAPQVAAPQEPTDDQFYRRVEPLPPAHHNPRILLAWLGILSGPIAIMVTSSLHLILPRPVLLGAGLTFVACAIYLIAQLPERGPSEPWWPDDGAQI
ncbi:MAG TPA: hypothetical protein VM093_07430 [Aeromicrobium sp.]|nr:hypothetical protein [Aeromicrobium sp.]